MTVAPATRLDALALAAQAADDVVLGTVRGVHDAVSARVHGTVGGTLRGTPGGALGGGVASVTHRVHRGIAGGVFAGVSGGLRLGSAGLRLASRHGAGGGALDDSPAGRFLSGAVNGLIGDQLREEAHPVYFDMAVRHEGREVAPTREALEAAYPAAGGKVVVFVHGLCEVEDVWWRPECPRREQPPRRSYGDRLVAQGWTPVYLRVNTGLPVGENGAALSALLQRLTEEWPVAVDRLALVGHSMGGLVVRAAGAVSSDRQQSWTDLVTDVVCLGTPHLGAPLERVVERGVRALGRLPEAAPFGRILEFRSVGILDLRHGLSPDVQNLPHARYRLVGATLSRRPDGPGSGTLGDLLVPFASAMGRSRDGTEMFPGAETLHVQGDHFDLLNHDRVHTALEQWLADRDDAPTRAESPTA